MNLLKRAAVVTALLGWGVSAQAAGINLGDYDLEENGALYSTAGGGTVNYVFGFGVFPETLLYSFSDGVNISGSGTGLDPASQSLFGGPLSAIGAADVVLMAGNTPADDSLLEILFTSGMISGGTDGLLVRATGDFGAMPSLGFFTELANISVIDLSSTVTPVPLPAGLPLMLGGLAGFAFLRRKSKSA